MKPKTFDFNWFNLHPTFFLVFGQYVKLFNLFNRRSAEDGHLWGVGLIQIGNRHLFFVGSDGSMKRLAFLFVHLIGFRKIAIPFDRIHHLEQSYGWLILPTPKGWIAFFDRKELRNWNNDLVAKYSFSQRFKLVTKDRFHNCTATGRY
ncbi:hypothetical protein [Spirosoma oryzicola]|uniref:hypothetical protein n=1 Tax=Spirosoma oryzicola TaxID=2898794 RepID=UPI001E47826D|nr:hypothetical protein [Spirosoma oryzicola]UHG93230.1 hypothetical protein LQ777_10095 [Spirosoma oryzicola]